MVRINSKGVVKKLYRLMRLSVCLFFLGSALSAQMAPVTGDVNGNGSIDILDALMIARYYVGLSPDGFLSEVADVNFDEDINIIDALLVAQFYVGLITGFPNPNGMEVIQSDLPRQLAPQLPVSELDSVVNGNNQVTFDIYRQIRTAAGNIFYSPLSLSFALAMCYAGANGNTESEIAAVMHFELPEPNLHNALNSLELTLTREPAVTIPKQGEELELHIVNSTWGQKDYTFLPAFLDVLAVNYGAGLNIVDFISNPDGCRLLINDWVSAQTAQKIKDLLPGGSLDIWTRLVLVNAIYFKANWLFPFNAVNTVNAPFYPLTGGMVSVPMMNRVINTGYYEVAGQYQAVSLPYQGIKRNSMIVILPEAGQFENVEAGMTAGTFEALAQGMRNHQVTLAMPKFSFEWSQSMKTILHSLGMQDAFNEMQADFSGINGNTDLYITEVVHKAFVAVDEIGTEAAAATAVIFGTTSIPQPATMTINRPFLFLIRNDNTGAILFAGRVLQP